MFQRALPVCLSIVPSVIFLQQVIENVADMSQYGLTEDTRTIQYETANEIITLEAGIHNSMASIYYICLPAETTVYTVDNYVINVFNKTLENLKI